MKLNCLAAFLALFAACASAQPAFSAKSLFFAEDDTVKSVSTASQPVTAVAAAKAPAKPAATVVAARKPNIPVQIGASYFVRLKNTDGSNKDVLTTRKFQSGERFQLGVKVNKPTYITILNEAPDGQITQIYPQSGKDNLIDAMGTVFLPTQGAFEFDGKPGTEKLLVYLSPTPSPANMKEYIRRTTPDVVSVPVSMVATTPVSCNAARPVGTPAMTSAPPGMQVAQANADVYASKGIAFKEDSTAACASASKVNLETFASKGIVFTDDAAPADGGQVASYVVKKVSAEASSSANIYLKINLVHE